MSDATDENPETAARESDGGQGGLGSEGTIPDAPGGVGVGAGEATTFEPEEDPDAAARRDPDAPDGADAS